MKTLHRAEENFKVWIDISLVVYQYKWNLLIKVFAPSTPAWVLLYVPVAVIKLNRLELLFSWQAVSWLSEVSLVQGAIWMGFLSTMSVPCNLVRSIHKNAVSLFPHLSAWYGCQCGKERHATVLPLPFVFINETSLWMHFALSFMPKNQTQTLFKSWFSL